MHALLKTVAVSTAALMLAAGARAESPATGENHDRSVATGAHDEPARRVAAATSSNVGAPGTHGASSWTYKGARAPTVGANSSKSSPPAVTARPSRRST